jgi:hypothetical protein
MRDDGDNPLKYQGRLEALRTSPLNAMECENFVKIDGIGGVRGKDV